MKKHIALSSLVAVAFLTGCEKKSQPETDLTDAARSATETAPAAVAENMDAAVAAAEEQFKALDAKIAELAKKAEGYKDDAKVQADKALADLRVKQTQLNEKLTVLKAKSADAWASAKAGFAAAMIELEKACENAKESFK